MKRIPMPAGTPKPRLLPRPQPLPRPQTPPGGRPTHDHVPPPNTPGPRPPKK